MIQFMWIKGLSVGLEYDENPEYGFVINCDLGLFRITWFKDAAPD